MQNALREASKSAPPSHPLSASAATVSFGIIFFGPNIATSPVQ
jgi:hypothetical protein